MPSIWFYFCFGCWAVIIPKILLVVKLVLHCNSIVLLAFLLLYSLHDANILDAYSMMCACVGLNLSFVELKPKLFISGDGMRNLVSDS